MLTESCASRRNICARCSHTW